MNYRSLATYLFLGATLTLVACAQQQPSNTTAANSEEKAVEIRKSPNDPREYRYLQLPNKLRVVLVSDADTEQAAASLSVYRGSFHEPENKPGLAHFLEHMLFIQTEAYPEIDGFHHYISANGGSSNAYTALDHTNYFFSVRPEALPEALDRWAHFFIDPILSPEYSQREKNAVHSEYQMQYKDDGWRGYMVGKQAINPVHPASKFTIGSLDTLAGDIHEDLLEFFETYYSADQMGLVVISNQSLDDMQAYIAPLFSKIENKEIGPDHPDVAMYTDAQVPALLEVQTQKEGANVSYLFPMPSTRPGYKDKPENYLNNLIGHEGKGSLHRLLNSLGWIESLGASVVELDYNMSALSVGIDLTPAGRDKVDEITDLLFQYVDMVKSQPPQQWLYKEQAQVAELGFQFQEKSSPTGLVYQLSPRIDEFPPEDLLIAPYLMEKFDAEAVKSLLSYVREDNVLMRVSAPDIQGQLEEPWFKVPYNLTKGPIVRKAFVQNSLSLPPKNPFLPDDLSVAGDDHRAITQLVKQPGLELWFDSDTEFGSPRANLYLELAVPGGFVSPKDRGMAQLYRLMVEDSLKEVTYPAYLAGLGYSIGVPDSGFQIHIGGYQDKQKTLLDTVLTALLDVELQADRFAVMKEQLIKDWRNAAKDRPYGQAFSALSDTLRSGRWSRPILAEALRTVTIEELEAWRKKSLQAFAVRGMLHGNADDKDAQVLADYLATTLPLAEHGFLRASVKNVDSQLRLAVDVDHNDASIVLHVQDPDESFASRARSSLAAQLLQPSYHQQLRTEQQLGYVAYVTNRPVAKRGGLSFVIQSPNTSAAGLEQATTKFVEDFVQAWAEITLEEFEQQKTGLLSRLREQPKNLNDRSSRLWADLSDEVYSFDSRDQVADLVEALTQDDMRDYLNNVQRKLATERIIIYTKGKFAEVPSAGRLLTDANDDWQKADQS